MLRKARVRQELFVQRFFMATSPTTRGNTQPVSGLRLCLRRMVVMVGALGFYLALAETASASCGNYLFRNGKPVSSHSMDQTTGMESESPHSEALPLEVPMRRCSGPNCSSNPLPLAPVPAAPLRLGSVFDQAAILEKLAQADLSRSVIEIPESERGACYEPSSIFRPPMG